MKMPTEGLRSKSWEEFAAPGAAAADFVFTVCDNAAGEVCPYWPGQPMTAHWGIPDPAAVEGTDKDKWVAFRDGLQIRSTTASRSSRVSRLASLDRIKLQEQPGRDRQDAVTREPHEPGRTASSDLEVIMSRLNVI